MGPLMIQHPPQTLRDPPKMIFRNQSSQCCLTLSQLKLLATDGVDASPMFIDRSVNRVPSVLEHGISGTASSSRLAFAATVTGEVLAVEGVLQQPWLNPWVSCVVVGVAGNTSLLVDCGLAEDCDTGHVDVGFVDD